MGERRDDGDGLGADARGALAWLLDQVLPPSDDGRLPGAGALGLAAPLADALAAEDETRALVTRGLAALGALVEERGAARPAALPPGERAAVLAELDARVPGLLPLLHARACLGYYQQPRVLEGLGLAPRPPHPEGYEVPPSDLDTLLEPVRRRPPLYRKA